jgi:hypothetical protein
METQRGESVSGGFVKQSQGEGGEGEEGFQLVVIFGGKQRGGGGWSVGNLRMKKRGDWF